MKKTIFVIILMIISITPVRAQEQTTDQSQASAAKICFSLSSDETQSFTVYDASGIPVTISVTATAVSGEKRIYASNKFIQMEYYIYTASNNIISAYKPNCILNSGNIISSSLTRNSNKKATYTVTCKRLFSQFTYKLIAEIQNDELIVSLS